MPIESFEDVLRLSPDNVGRMVDEQEEYYGRVYADDPEEEA
jgi:hypothetical protein